MDSNITVENQLDIYAEKLGKRLSASVISFCGPIMYGTDDVVRDAVEALDHNKDKLVVLVETTGGYIEVVQRIANTFRRHYPKAVDFIIPNYSMSAGTVLVMSGDNIYIYIWIITLYLGL